jgi:hypothetical protein
MIIILYIALVLVLSIIFGEIRYRYEKKRNNQNNEE